MQTYDVVNETTGDVIVSDIVFSAAVLRRQKCSEADANKECIFSVRTHKSNIRIPLASTACCGVSISGTSNKATLDDIEKLCATK